MLKNIACCGVIILFSVFSGPVFAGGIDGPCCGSGASASGSGSDRGADTVFQKASKNIATWDRTAPEAKDMSLRGNKCELKKRRMGSGSMLF